MVGVGTAAGHGIGRLLRRYRLQAGLTQDELADKTGLSVRAISDIERGITTRPQARSLRMICEALGLPDSSRKRMMADLTHANAEEGTGPETWQRSGGADGGKAGRLLTPRQLPAAVKGFAGRVQELAVLGRMVRRVSGDSFATPIAAIGGPAGVGKTALAVEFAHRVAAEFPDGQLFVNLRGFGPTGAPMAPREAIHEVLSGLSSPAEQLPKSLDGQTALYRSLLADRRVLLVLDNACDEQQVRPLLPGGARTLTVITSRRTLIGLAVVENANLIELEALSEQESRDLLTARLGREQVGIEAEAAAELTALCDRLPLAIAIVAARAHFHRIPLHEAVAELLEAGRRLDILDNGDPAASMRAVLSRSYQNLGPRAAALFRQLGLCSGSDISLSAAASLTGLSRPTARAVLRELVEVHLLTERAPSQFVIHELTRAYAAEQGPGGRENKAASLR